MRFRDLIAHCRYTERHPREMSREIMERFLPEAIVRMDVDILECNTRDVFFGLYEGHPWWRKRGIGIHNSYPDDYHVTAFTVNDDNRLDACFDFDRLEERWIDTYYGA